jgi:hypothetical protein
VATLTITLNTSDGAAMADGGDGAEVEAILVRLAHKAGCGALAPGDDRPVYDTNGGRVGTVVWRD